MTLTLHGAARLADGRVVGPAAREPILRWAYDSRLPYPAAGTCFLALPGPRRSGFAYVPDLASRGVSLFAVSEADAAAGLPEADATYWVVDDVLAALQRLAAAYRRSLDALVVGVTGSNGKTVVKEWLAALLGGAPAGVVRSPGSFNSQLGVALSLLAVPAETRVAIVEAGVSRAGEMARLAEMVRPEVGVLTNLGSAHDAGFATRSDKLAEKLGLFAGSELVVARADAAYGTGVEAVLGKRLLRWSADGAPAGDYVLRFGSDTWRIESPGAAPLTLPLPFRDAASRENLAHAVVAALLVSERRGEPLPPPELARRIRGLRAEPSRLTAFRSTGGGTVVDDSRTSDLEGWRAALDFFAQQRPAGGSGASMLVTGGLAEPSDEVAARVRELIAASNFDEVIAVGALPDGLPPKPVAEDPTDHTTALSFVSADELLADTRTMERLHAARAVLVKGPTVRELDRVALALRPRRHEVRLELDLDAVADNLAAFRRRLAPTTKVCFMAKAAAYGAGDRELAHALAERGVDYLAVAYADEGVALRRAGIALPILVGNAWPRDRELLRAHELEPEVTTLAQLRGFAGRPLHLKLDTGMHRLGFDVTPAGSVGGDFEALLAELPQGDYRVQTVFSHLSAADDPTADPFTRAQATAFESACARVDAALGYRPLRHLANSAAAWRLPELQYGMVRLGIGAYGLGAAAVTGELRPAHRMVAQLTQVRDVAAGEVVGYGLGGRADHARRIGVVNVGYADGLRRAAGNGRYALGYAGADLPTVGNVCMDFTMVDLAAAPGARVGDEVEVFGPERPLDALAEVCGTIAYELLTGIGQRVRRVYRR